MSTSVLTRSDVSYPSAESWFCPGERYPEYPFDDVAGRPNPVYAMVRELFAQLGLDRDAYGTSDWNPLGRYIEPGARVFVLCNFVYHRRPSDTLEDLHAKCVHGAVLRALVDYALIAAGPDASVRFGNSPLQSCDWDRVLSETGAARVAEFYETRAPNVRPSDLRLYVAERSNLGSVEHVEHRDDAMGVEAELDAHSLLAAFDGNGSAPRYRVSDYDPDRLESFHADRSHRYVIHRDVLDADTVISLSKLKTHEKVGITCGLKGFVGAVAHKDCLAHHRFGGARRHGDEYPPGAGLLLEPASHYHDWLNRRGQDASFQRPLQIVDRNLRRALRRAGFTTAGAWHGNDTCWRMALDLAQILFHADAAGRLHASPQRRHLSLIDGIVAGEGDGPLAARPVEAGTLVFSDDVAVGDRAAARLMGFDPQQIPLIREAFSNLSYPITSERGAASPVCFNGREIGERELAPILRRPFASPAGWRPVLRPAA